ncbi:MAG: 2-oxo acid dehydrogenase subunit E2 [Gammaproteobacteria bacterium]|nr:2-oxo acid dehydrogenase subunit E2 [Gammaproteobacteria bacterium]
MKIFHLPDLGEGLTDAEIVEWHVDVGDEVVTDAPLVTVETAKAVVDIPSPFSGNIVRRFGEAGDIVETGKPLVGFAGNGEQRVDAGTVVGKVEASDERLEEAPAVVGTRTAGVRATPAVRALAQRFDVDLSIVSPSGQDHTITRADVERVARRLEELGPAEPLRGARRAMAIRMTRAHAEVVPATIMDDADVDAWRAQADVTVRLIRAIVAACCAEPSLNAWYDSHSNARRVLERIDVAVAVDTEEGLFAPVVRDVGNRDDNDLRAGLDRLKQDVIARRIPAEEMRDSSITFSNYGAIGGRYAAPVIVPPTVAIVATGRIEKRVIAVEDRPAVRRTLPVVLSFDHRAVTGGEAARFLAALIAFLEQCR